MAESLAWLCRAQDSSATVDGGVARHYSLISGWGASYPETTGYIIPTLLEAARTNAHGADDLRERARRMLDWLVGIQLEGGGFQGGTVDQRPVVPVVFNTGQILLGLAAGVREFGDAYGESMQRAAAWLCTVQDADGCWRHGASPFARAGDKTYDLHVAWGLFEAARVSQKLQYATAALANVKWALKRQQPNGWLADCCLTDVKRPLTHTLGYALRGLVEAWLYSGDPTLLAAARRMAEGLMSALGEDGFLPGRLDAAWRAAVPWACLTGTVQIAQCWLQLHAETGDERMRAAALAGNRYVRRTIAVDGPPELRGGVRGSFPIDGEYGRFQLLNWAAKFTIDAQRMELDVTRVGHAEARERV